MYRRRPTSARKMRVDNNSAMAQSFSAFGTLTATPAAGTARELLSTFRAYGRIFLIDDNAQYYHYTLRAAARLR